MHSFFRLSKPFLPVLCIVLFLSLSVHAYAADSTAVSDAPGQEEPDPDAEGSQREGYGTLYLHAIVQEGCTFPIYVRIFGAQAWVGEFDVYLTPDRDYSESCSVPAGAYLVYQKVDHLKNDGSIAVSDVESPLVIEEGGSAHANFIAGSPDFVGRYKSVLFERDAYGKVDSGTYSSEEMDQKLEGVSQGSENRYEKEKVLSFGTEFEPDSDKPLPLTPAESAPASDSPIWQRRLAKLLYVTMPAASALLIFALAVYLIKALGNRKG